MIGPIQTFPCSSAMPPFSETALFSLAWWRSALENIAWAQYSDTSLLRSTECYREQGWRILRWHLEVVPESKCKPGTGSTVLLSSFFVLTIVCKNHTEQWKLSCGFLGGIFCPKSNLDIFFRQNYSFNFCYFQLLLLQAPQSSAWCLLLISSFHISHYVWVTWFEFPACTFPLEMWGVFPLETGGDTHTHCYYSPANTALPF